MAEKADYYVIAVQFNTHGTHIDWLQCRKNEGSKLGPVQKFSRQSVIDAINKGTTFMTAVKNSEGVLVLGQTVYAYSMTAHFLKTRADGSTRDNLDNLPTF